MLPFYHSEALSTKSKKPQIILETVERGCLSRSTFDNP